ncbi:hypothetical protein BpHYR1_034214 [Brachionus plicatilis]|uniref:Uncharacterized protein n=1 Tax=Brachionus plicatilis TaxID=10195 RepID=A0A3M7SME0_BRAPC|nr:hypothetical protein BpHYR1_034214 [Brachionus plicatilis]
MAQVTAIDHLDQVGLVYQVIQNSEAVEPTKRAGRPTKLKANVELSKIEETQVQKKDVVDHQRPSQL